MKFTKRITSLLLTVIMLVSMVPAMRAGSIAETISPSRTGITNNNLIQTNAISASWDLKSGGKVYAGEVGTITCYGGAAYQQTNVWFQADYPTMGYVTRYDKNGQQVSQRQICGSADFYDLSVTGGETYVVETYVGAIKITYNTANTLNPQIEVTDGGIDMSPKTNIYPNYELYLTPGGTRELFVRSKYPGCYFELNPQYYYYDSQHYFHGYSAYYSENSSIATIDDKGKITAIKEGDTIIKVSFKFGFSSDNYFTNYIETIVHVTDQHDHYTDDSPLDDGIISIRDISYLLMLMQADASALDYPAADLNGDGLIGIRDVSYGLVLLSEQ